MSRALGLRFSEGFGRIRGHLKDFIPRNICKRIFHRSQSFSQIMSQKIENFCPEFIWF